MKVLYQCEICGHISEDKTEIEEHEKRGVKNPQFSPGDKIEYYLGYNYDDGKYYGNEGWVKAEVVKVIRFGPENHTPQYEILYNLDSNNRDIPNWLMPLSTTSWEYRWIRPLRQ